MAAAMASVDEESERARIRAEITKKATSRVRARVGLSWHVVVFALVNAALYFINMRFTPNTEWFVWPLAGWGVALALHAFAVLQMGGLTEDMIEAEIRRELEKRGMR